MFYIPVGKIAKKKGVKWSVFVNSALKSHSYRLLFRRFCPLGYNKVSSILTILMRVLHRKTSFAIGIARGWLALRVSIIFTLQGWHICISAKYTSWWSWYKSHGSRYGKFW